MKVRNVRPCIERDPELPLVLGLLIVLRNAFPDLRRRNSHDRVGRRVVICLAAKYLHAQGTFLQNVQISGKSLADHEAEKGRKPAALIEMPVRQHTFELFFDLRRLNLACVGWMNGWNVSGHEYQFPPLIVTRT